MPDIDAAGLCHAGTPTWLTLLEEVKSGLGGGAKIGEELAFEGVLMPQDCAGLMLTRCSALAATAGYGRSAAGGGDEAMDPTRARN